MSSFILSRNAVSCFTQDKHARRSFQPNTLSLNSSINCRQFEDDESQRGPCCLYSGSDRRAMPWRQPLRWCPAHRSGEKDDFQDRATIHANHTYVPDTIFGPCCPENCVRSWTVGSLATGRREGSDNHRAMEFVQSYLRHSPLAYGPLSFYAKEAR